MHPDLGSKVSVRQANFDRLSRDREFSVGEEVLVENFRGEPEWLEGTVVERTGPVSYEVQVDDRIRKRHTDQLREKSFESTGRAPAVAIDDPFERSRDLVIAPTPVSRETPQTSEEREGEEKGTANARDLEHANAAIAAAPTSSSAPPDTNQPIQQPRYPTRERKVPVRLGFDE